MLGKHDITHDIILDIILDSIHDSIHDSIPSQHKQTGGQQEREHG